MQKSHTCRTIAVYWATLLESAVIGYDARIGCFDKNAVSVLKFKDRCYFVEERDLPLGIAKAQRTAQSVAKREGRSSQVCVLKSELPLKELSPHTEGFGLYRMGGTFPVSQIFLVKDGALQPLSVEALAVFTQEARQ